MESDVTLTNSDVSDDTIADNHYNYLQCNSIVKLLQIVTYGLLTPQNILSRYYADAEHLQKPFFCR